MNVRIDQARNNGAAAEIDHARSGIREGANLGCRADGGDAAIAHRERLRGRCAKLHNLSIDEDDVGRSRTSIGGSKKQKGQHQNTGPGDRQETGHDRSFHLKPNPLVCETSLQAGAPIPVLTLKTYSRCSVQLVSICMSCSWPGRRITADCL